MEMDGGGEIGRPLLWAARFLDLQDVIPKQHQFTWYDLCRVLVTSQPTVREDVSRETDRRLSQLHQIGRALFAERIDERLQRTWAFRELAKVVLKARREGLSEAEVRDRARARYEQLREEARKRAKARLPGWSPTEYAPYQTREAIGVLAITLLVLDYDDGTPIEDAIGAWEGWPLVVHTTWNHVVERPRFRLVIPLAEPIPAPAWLSVWSWAHERSCGHIDEACKDPSRMYLLPAIPRPGAPFRALVQDEGGPFLRVDWRALKPPEQNRTARPASPRDRPWNVGRGREPVDETRRAVQLMLRTDRATRERAAVYLDAHISGPRAERIMCPSCGRLSVWFWVEPGRQNTAVCNHRKTCGWWGHIDELLDLRGGAHVG